MTKRMQHSMLLLVALSLFSPAAFADGSTEWDPVCGVDGKTYSNACLAGATEIARKGTCARSEAYFCVGDAAGDAFVLKVVEPSKIDHARRVLWGLETEVVHVDGDVIESPAVWNPEWNFHVDPPSVSFFDYSIEVCDASIAWVDKFGGPYDGFWCPWHSEILAEISVSALASAGTPEAVAALCGAKP